MFARVFRSIDQGQLLSIRVGRRQTSAAPFYIRNQAEIDSRRWPDERDRRRWLLGLTRQGQALNRETPGTIQAAVRRVLKTTARADLDVTRAVLDKLARELDGGSRSRVSGMRR